MSNKNLIKNTNRFGCVDIVRFLMINLIMMHHLYVLGYSENYPGANCWAWVDYFFLLTGFFTMHHFSTRDITYSPAQSAMNYTIKKFKGYLPYVLVSVVTQYLIVAIQEFSQQKSIHDFVVPFVSLPYELMLLSSSDIVWPKVAPIWFLSAMLLTLPILIYMLLRFKDLWCILSWLIPVLYYGKMGINTLRVWPNDLVRAFAGMALGTFVYTLVQKMKQKTPSSINYKIFFSLVELGVFFLCVCITVKNMNSMNILLLLFVINSTIMLSRCSCTAKINGSVCTLLGEISLPMFLFHWPIGHIATIVTQSSQMRLCIYYLGTILVSFIAILIKHRLQKIPAKV